MKRRRFAAQARPGFPPPELLAFVPEDWSDAPLSPVETRGDLSPSPALRAVLPPDLARQMAAWARWIAARQRWADAHGDRWPTGAVERWVEERAARPGGRQRQAAGVTR